MKRSFCFLLIFGLLITLCACTGVSSREKAENAILSEIRTKCYAYDAYVSVYLEEVEFKEIIKSEDRWVAKGELEVLLEAKTYAGEFTATIDGEVVEVESSVLDDVRNIGSRAQREKIKEKYDIEDKVNEALNKYYNN